MSKSDEIIWDYFQNNGGGEIRSHFKMSYPRQDLLFKSIKKRIGIGGKIFEIGFGNGYLLNKLSLNGYDVVGQDISSVNIEATKKQRNNKDIKFFQGDCSGKLLIGDESVDGYVASEVLEHMSDEELETNIGEIYRILKKGGYAFITFPCRENLEESFCICPECGTTFHKVGHKQSLNNEKIKSTFKKFKIIQSNARFFRYPGKNKKEAFLGLLMFYLRTFINCFIDLEGKTYVIILKKE